MSEPVIILENLTGHPEFFTRARLVKMESGVPTVVVEIHSGSKNKGEETLAALKKELDQTKQVLGDLLQEKLNGLKVYTVHGGEYGDKEGIEVQPHIHLSLQSAKDLVHGRCGAIYEWKEYKSNDKPWWSTSWCVYHIEEHELLALPTPTTVPSKP